MKKVNKIIPVVSLALGLSLVAGISVYAVSNSDADISDNKTVIEEFPVGVNKNGQTYGSASDASTEDELPDLISAVGNNGVVGYMLKEDFIGEDDQPANPEEAVEYMKELRKKEAAGISGKTVPLYDVDGVTIVDTFTIGKEDNNSETYYIDKNGAKINAEIK